MAGLFTWKPANHLLTKASRWFVGQQGFTKVLRVGLVRRVEECVNVVLYDRLAKTIRRHIS